MCIRIGRNFPALNEMFRVHSIDYEWNGESIEPNFTAISVIHFIRQLTKDLCATRPKGRESFLKAASHWKPDHFSTREGFSVYKLEKGRLKFAYDVGK